MQISTLPQTAITSGLFSVLWLLRSIKQTLQMKSLISAIVEFYQFPSQYYRGVNISEKYRYCPSINPTLNMIRLSTVICFTFFSIAVFAQTEKPAVHVFTKRGKGVGLVTADSSFSLNYQFRIQNRATFVSPSEKIAEPESFEFRVRRLRMKFEGFVYDPRLTYYIQLSFSRGDMDWRGPDDAAINSSPNVVRDAVIYYNPTRSLRLGFGQTKLPGNRQRVISSGDQQFADRSIVNATFNIDRDFGFFAHLSKEFFIVRGALTSGEGRNSLNSNKGLAYTGRIELLPLGKFTGSNDYIEGDLEREPRPKLSIAATYSLNDLALRQAGQLGNDLYAARSISNIELDFLFKYNGWAWYNEYMKREATNPITVSATDATRTRFIFVGEGYLTQLSYLFKNNFEIAGRYSTTIPGKVLYDNVAFPNLNETQLKQVEVGVTKYLVGHRLKIQGNAIYGERIDQNSKSFTSGFWSGIFQVEIGI
jgi:phosphate-selective porin OprO and OprP